MDIIALVSYSENQQRINGTPFQLKCIVFQTLMVTVKTDNSKDIPIIIIGISYCPYFRMLIIDFSKDIIFYD